ncbi:SDR family oxidoreductase [bacterium]|nr:SDR family oxidoreductase [bacterium]
MKTKEVNTALVIGGGAGMGAAISRRLAASGIHVFVADLDKKAAERTAMSIESGQSHAEALEVDIADSQSVQTLFNTLKQTVERLDLMVNTAGILGKVAFIEEMDDDCWQQVIDINLNGTFYCCRESVRWMKEHGTGRIILFSSVASLTPSPGSLHYSAAKAGVNMLGKTLAKEVAKHNIRVNIIAPGYVKTAMTEMIPEKFMKHVIENTPLKRMGEVEEIAELVAFLASPKADFFTGQVIGPNGGWVI